MIYKTEPPHLSQDAAVLGQFMCFAFVHPAAF